MGPFWHPRKLVRQRFSGRPGLSLIYLDFNRTTPLAPSAMEAMQPFWSTHYMLPGQEHPHAQAVSEALESARENVAMMAGCEPYEIVFTSGGTEANNLAILGVAATATNDSVVPIGSDPLAQHRSLAIDSGHALVSALEHDSVLGATQSLLRQGWEIESVECNADGVIDPEEIAGRLRGNTRLVCLQLANPILGTIQPVREVADICHNHGIPVHCDATQGFGKIPVDLSQLRVDTAAISGHKIYGPKGSGAMYVRRGFELTPISFGEPREMGLRPGAENVPALIGFGTAAALAARCCVEAADTLAEIRDRLVAGLQSSFGDDVQVHCEDAERLPNTISVQLPGDAQRIQQAARQLVVARAQSDAPPDEMTRALRCIGLSPRQIGRTLRLSLGWTTSRDQVDRAIEMLAEATDRAKS